MDNKIYCSFCILDRTSNKHQKIHKFLKEKELETKTLNTYYDEHSECSWYIISDCVLDDEKFLEELDKILESDYNYYGSL